MDRTVDLFINFLYLENFHIAERNVLTKKSSTNTCIDCGKLISEGATRCPECAKIHSRTVERPQREEFKMKIRTEAFTQVAKDYNVSDIRKWCDYFGFPRRKSDINAISDEDWEKM